MPQVITGKCLNVISILEIAYTSVVKKVDKTNFLELFFFCITKCFNFFLESVRRAVTATGLTSVAPLETVAQAAGQDLTVQTAYRDLLRSSVQAAVQNNEDFTPDRFPNASNYFSKQ